jgi:glycosyltransferase involved in cell wall biosynthesis
MTSTPAGGASLSSCLFLLSWPPTAVGGVNEAVLGLARALQTDSKLKPIIAVTSWSPAVLPNAVRGIPLIGLQLHDGYDAGVWTAIKSAARLPSDLRAIASALRLHDVKVVNIHFPSLGSAAVSLLQRLRLYKGKVALTFHGADIRHANASGRLARRGWRAFINSVDQVFVCSQALADEVRQLCPQKQVRVIYNGADIGLFASVVRNRGCGQKRILNVGKFEGKKSQDVLLASFKLLLDRGVDCTLTMIGARGSTTEQIRQAASAFGDRVRMLVDVEHDQIPEHMAHSDLFVLPSRAEGFPIVLIEAGAVGLPVVASNIPGVTELITDGTTGVLVAPDDPNALADAMATVLDSPAIAETLGANLRAKALGFTWRQYADQFTEALS